MRRLNEDLGKDETDRLRKEHKYKKIKETLGKDIDYIDPVPVSTCSSGFKCVEPTGNIYDQGLTGGEMGKKYMWEKQDNECVNLDKVCDREFSDDENMGEDACTYLNVQTVSDHNYVTCHPAGDCWGSSDPYADKLCKKLKEDINTWDDTGN